ncbi:alpha carbonic anhydrase 7-like [Mercurialis annua]|uniref:alpha carbonic anhydrase 7-like n=1 Tax=Mercurialis annua TaxID=3986 RepID=UPI00215E9187|nr:alpha carbonic anhydrase 7-like [Mercurialis annua]
MAIQLLCITLFISFLLHAIPTSSQETADEHDFDYRNSEKGPGRWGLLRKEWSACSNGSMQSPVDLLNERVEVVSHLGTLKRSYHPSNATLKNRGHDMMLNWESGAGSLQINGTDYILKQCHWHSPSEHAVNGKRYDLEIHKVHESKDGKVAVVGIMYKIGRPDSFLASLEDRLRLVAGSKKNETIAGIYNPMDIKIGSRMYYSYIGSLTIPPCTENVLWIIFRKIRTVGSEQVKLLRVAVHDESNSNARPIQVMNGRSVQLYNNQKRILPHKLLVELSLNLLIMLCLL